MEKDTEEMLAALTKRLEKAESAVNSVAAKQKDAEDKEKESQLRAAIEKEIMAKYGITAEPKKEEEKKAEDTKDEKKSEDVKEAKEEVVKEEAGKDGKVGAAQPDVGTTKSGEKLGDTTPTYKTVADIIKAAKHY